MLAVQLHTWQTEAHLIEEYLPPELEDSELDAIVAAAIAETGASDPEDMGQVMKAVMAIRGPWSLRVEKDGELEGLDIFEHGTTAYHTEFGQGMTYQSPTGLLGMSRTMREDLPIWRAVST